MKLPFTISVILLVLTTATAQQTDLDDLNKSKFEPDGQIKGIGMVEFDLARDHFGNDLLIYDAAGQRKMTIRLTESGVTTLIGNRPFSSNDNTNPLKPRLFLPSTEFFRLIFDCTKSTDQYYLVIVDQQTNDIGFIKKSDKLFNFRKPAEYVTEWTAGSGFDFDRSQNPLRKEPSDNAAVIANNDQKKYKIWKGEMIEMKGDWMKVNMRSKEQGWIRWRKKDQILIRLYFAC